MTEPSIQAHLHDSPAPEPIPGAREANTATHRQPGSMGGRANGADLPVTAEGASMDADTINEHRHEGGGAEGDR